jgi:hypothetical protein
VLGLWWEERFAPRRADGFVDAMREALRAYLRFAGVDRLEWAPHLGTEKRLFRSRWSSATRTLVTGSDSRKRSSLATGSTPTRRGDS